MVNTTKPAQQVAEQKPGLPKDDVWVPSVCEMCYCHCGIIVHRVNGVVVKIEGDPNCPHNRGKLCAKGNAALLGVYDPSRVKTPLKRTNPEKGVGIDPKWQEITWKEAMDTVVEKLRKVRQDDPRSLVFASWDTSLTPGSVFGAWTAAWGGPTGLLNAYRCGAALHAATYEILSTFHTEVDLDYCDYLILFGNGKGFMVGVTPNLNAQKMAEARARGMKLVVVDPLCSTAAAKADEWVPIRPSTDGALALAMLNVLLNELNIYDAEFLRKYTNAPYLIGPDSGYVRDKASRKPMVWDSAENRAKPFDGDVGEFAIEGSYVVDGIRCSPAFQLLKDHVRKYTPEEASEITTIPAATIRRLAREFGQAARIGSKIVIRGKELPYRPAAANYYKGVTPRKHGTLASLSIHLLNFAVGAVYVPGGHTGLNIVGPEKSWVPGKDPDGLSTPAHAVGHGFNPFDINVRPPQQIDLKSFLPAMHSGAPTVGICIAEPEKYKAPVAPAMLLHCRANMMMSRENLRDTAETITKIPFMVSFAYELDETAEFADIVLPDVHALERLALFPNQPHNRLSTMATDWHWGILQPVVPPAHQSRHYMEVLIEIADRLGFRDKFNLMCNSHLSLKDPFKLLPGEKYSLEQIFDRWARSLHGAEHGLEWFKEHGNLTKEKKTLERYPLVDLTVRFPIYFENYYRAGKEIKRVGEEAGIPWDVSDYLALLEWKPTPTIEKRGQEYDLFCVNYTIPIHFKSFTSQNPWLNELAENHPSYYKVLINADTARKRGIKEGDLITIESSAGKIQGRARVSQGVHPEVVGVAGTLGSWAKGKPIARGKGLHHNSLLPYNVERMDPVSGAVDDCVEVKVYKGAG
ncbi:MAG: molybdopterin-dependent oxidoreductase [Chloroflexi bacterium]|nr:molybdopterin-dependent oxidoreductase [Chloroflexota bacterium]